MNGLVAKERAVNVIYLEFNKAFNIVFHNFPETNLEFELGELWVKNGLIVGSKYWG